MDIKTSATITCPVCGHTELEEMPMDACLYFYECKACGSMLTPAEGDCCVFCSYADSKCPPKQMEAERPKT